MSRDLQRAQTFVDRAKAINAKHEVARQQMIACLSRAVELILIAAVVGVVTVLAVAPTEQKLKASAIVNQENIPHG